MSEMTIDERLMATSFLLGIAHGGVMRVLELPESEWRDHLMALKNELTVGISKLYYSEPTPHEHP